MKIYLASRYSRREELCGYRDDLEYLGHTVTSRWLDGNHQVDDRGLSTEAKSEERLRFACEDWEDLKSAEVCISFTEPPRTTNRLSRSLSVVRPASDGACCPPPPPWRPAGAAGAC